MFAHGTVLDPTTTRAVAAGQLDPRTGLQNTSKNTVYVRDPFYTGSLVGVRNFTGMASRLNVIPAGRLDPNAVNLLKQYPAQNRPGLANNYLNNPRETENINAYDIRIDQTFSGRDTVFAVWDQSLFSEFAPGALPGQNDQNDSFPLL